MLEILKAGGILIGPILIASVVALAIIIERFFALRESKVVPPKLLYEVYESIKDRDLDNQEIQALQQNSALGRILAVALQNRQEHYITIRETVEQEGTFVVHHMGRYLPILGTVAAITPLLGLLGTVIGMIKVFSVITTLGVGDPYVLSAGISEALVTTAAGLFVGIPSLVFYRYFRGRINKLAVDMEQQSLSFVKALKQKS